MTVNDSKSYLGYLNKLLDELIDKSIVNSYHRSIDKKTHWCWLFCFD